MSDLAFDDVAAVLKATDLRWMTASGIAKKLPIKEVEPTQVESVLIDHCSKREKRRVPPKVRYSSLPSRKTLEVLWGLIERVGFRKLSNITKDDVADESLSVGEYDGRADVFVSHSHRDYKDVMKVAEGLLKEDIVPWLAETHIGRGDHIHEKIIDALGAVDVFLLFLSPNALDSRWTGKEYGIACKKSIPIFVVGNIEFPEIGKILRAMGRHDKGNSPVVDKVRGDVRQFLKDLIADKHGLVETYGYSSKAADMPGVRPLTEMPSAIRKHLG